MYIYTILEYKQTTEIKFGIDDNDYLKNDVNAEHMSDQEWWENQRARIHKGPNHSIIFFSKKKPPYQHTHTERIKYVNK